MSELRVSKLVDASVVADREVSPDRGARLELDAVNLSTSGLEALVRVLGRDACGNHVFLDGEVLLLGKIDRGVLSDVLTIHGADRWDVGQRDAHGNLQLGCGQVDASEPLSDRVFHLQTRVELEEEEFVGFGIVQVLDGTGASVSDGLGQTHRCQLHLAEGLGLGDGWRPLLKDFLEAALRGAVTPVERDGVAVLVADNLNLEMARVLAKLHHEHRRSGDLVLHLEEVGPELLLVGRHPNSLSATTLGSLEHDGKSDLLRRSEALINTSHLSLLEHFVRDHAALIEVGLQRAVIGTAKRSRPRDARHLRGLGKDIRCDLVSKNIHDRATRTNELDSFLS
mmetsp:Transcript_37522/g.76970  ORF Transcript_37522/g.76970 Transcript_37522/m.76970 type:complete len:339 (+) Transcript_37522:4954-5970(+)